MPEDLVKQAFLAIKQDIYQLSNQISILNQELQQLQAQNNLVNSFIQDIQKAFQVLVNNQKILQKQQDLIQNQLKIAENALKEHISAHKAQNPTIQHITTTLPTNEMPFKALKTTNLPISIGNEGVPTNKQTNQQTNKHPIFAHGKMQKNAENIENEQKYDENPENLLKIASGVYAQPQQIQPKIQDQDQLNRASELLENLDSLKKQMRLKFKTLTPQEFKVFTAIYQLENMQLTVDYTLLSKKLKLSESSIRDYIGRIISKGIPIIKEKINNKQVIVHISADLKKIASLAAILQLREL